MAKGRAPLRWGAALAELRRSSKLSAAEVVKRLKALGIEIDRASVYTYEAGKVLAPDAGVVWGLAQIYGVSTDTLISELVAARRGEPSDTKLRESRELRRIGPASDETSLLELWRRLSPQQKKTCLEFLLFQASSGQSQSKRTKT